jgi:hypothetical protein
VIPTTHSFRQDDYRARRVKHKVRGACSGAGAAGSAFS